MAVIAYTKARLRIFGDDLIPEEITDLLGCSPSGQELKGEKIIGKKSGTVRTARTGRWDLQASKAEPGDFDAQIEEILGKLTTNISTWNTVASKNKLDLFCGLFMIETNEGISISSKNILALGQRHIKLGLDIYAPTSE